MAESRALDVMIYLMFEILMGMTHGVMRKTLYEMGGPLGDTMIER